MTDPIMELRGAAVLAQTPLVVMDQVMPGLSGLDTDACLTGPLTNSLGTPIATLQPVTNERRNVE